MLMAGFWCNGTTVAFNKIAELSNQRFAPTIHSNDAYCVSTAGQIYRKCLKSAVCICIH